MMEVDFLSFVFSLGIRVRGLALALLRSKTMRPGRSASSAGGKGGDRLLLVFHEGDLDAQFAGGLLDFGEEEEVFDEEDDLGGGVRGDGDGAALRVVDGLRIGLVALAGTVAATLVVAVGVGLDGGWRGLGEVAVDGAVAVVHGADEAARAALLLLAAATEAAALALGAGVVAELVGVGAAEAATAGAGATVGVAWCVGAGVDGVTAGFAGCAVAGAVILESRPVRWRSRNFFFQRLPLADEPP